MGIRKILTEPDPILRQKSLEVKAVDKDLQNLMDDMLLTMYSAPGIGLAAIQVGIPKRVIVIDISREKEKKNTDWSKRKKFFHKPIMPPSKTLSARVYFYSQPNI